MTQVSFLPNHLYLFWAIKSYKKSRQLKGKKLKIVNSLQGIPKTLKIFKIADDFSYSLSSCMKMIEFKPFFLCLWCNKILSAASDCKEANRNCFFLSRLSINWTDELHKLHMPSNKIIEF